MMESEQDRAGMSSPHAVSSIFVTGCELPTRRFLSPLSPQAPHVAPQVECPEIDPRSWSSWDEVGAALEHAPVVPFRQGWREDVEAGFVPASVALAHFQNQLIIYAELGDLDIFNPVREHGVHAYKLGDVFEIFLKGEGEENYFEHHFTPDGYTIQLEFPSSTTFYEICKKKHPDWKTKFAGTVPIPAQVLAQPELGLWRVLALVPLDQIGARKGVVAPRWRFSFCRYDYTRGHPKPVLSSTSATGVANFHNQSGWGSFTLGPARK